MGGCSTLRLDDLRLLSQGRRVVEHPDDVDRERSVFDIVDLPVHGQFKA